MALLNLRAISAAALISWLASATGADAAIAFSLGYAAAQDIGTANVVSAIQPPAFSSSTFPNRPFSADSDGGCGADAFSNFGGPGGGPANVPTCGDTLIFKGVSNGTVGVTAGMLTDTTTPNGTGLEFHVEDSPGKGTQSSSLPETLTVAGLSNTFDLPYTVTFTSSADTFQISAFDINVCIKNGTGGACNANHNNGTDYWIVSPGTMLLTGGNSDGNDDWAFETNLVGCVATNSNPGLGSCGTTPAGFVSFFAADPPPLTAVPEPPACVAVLFWLIALATTLNRRRRANQTTTPSDPRSAFDLIRGCVP